MNCPTHPIRIGLVQITDFGVGDRRTTAGRFEVNEDQRVIPNPDGRIQIGGFQHGDCFILTHFGGDVLFDARGGYSLDIADPGSRGRFFRVTFFRFLP